MTILLNGTTSRIGMGPTPELAFDRLDPFSISVRASIRPNGGSWQGIFSRYDPGSNSQGYLLSVSNTGNLVFQFINNWGAANRLQKEVFAVTTGGWHHYVVTHDGTGTTGGINFYIDGEPASPTITPYNTLSGSTAATTDLTIGADSSLARNLGGHVDECAAYNKELSAAEVETIYGSPHYIPDLNDVGPSANLVGYWKMGEDATYPTIPDESPNSNPGTMVGMTSGDLSFLDPPPSGGPTDLVLPAVDNILPADGTAIDAGDIIQFDVTDDVGFARVMVVVTQGTILEVVHDGDSFAPTFAGSFRVAIPGGWRYSVRKTGGWAASPTFKVHAIDSSGNQAT